MQKKKYVTIEEKQKTRDLCQNVFQNVSKDFLDFYYNQRCFENRIYVYEEGDEVVSMLHCNPYSLILNCYPGHKSVNGDYTQHVVTAPYLVRIATKEEYRDRGLMTDLLKDCLQDMYALKVPFVYVAPNSERLYTQLQFRYIWNKQKFVLNEDRISTQLIKKALSEPQFIPGKRKEQLEIAKITEEEYLGLALFMNRFCYDRYGVFAKRNEQYMELLRTELHTIHGEILLIKKEDGEIIGYFTFDQEHGEINVHECGVMEKYSDFEFFLPIGEKKPMIMARIVHLKTLMENLHSKKSVEICMKVTDPILLENNGTFLLHTNIYGTRLERLQKSYYEGMWEDHEGQDHIEEVETSIENLASFVFGYGEMDSCFQILSKESGLEQEIRYKVKCLRPYGEAFVNEFV